MFRLLRKLIGGLVRLVVLAVAGAAAVLVLGMRRQDRRVVDTMRRFARDVGNPRTMSKAGMVGSSASVIEHVGRTSGRQYRTPVTAVRSGDTFVIALPYGPQTDWLRNVLAAGSAHLQYQGRRVAVERPEVLPLADVLSAFEGRERRFVQTFGVREALRLHPVTPGA